MGGWAVHVRASGKLVASVSLMINRLSSRCQQTVCQGLVVVPQPPVVAGYATDVMLAG